MQRLNTFDWLWRPLFAPVAGYKIPKNKIFKKNLLFGPRGMYIIYVYKEVICMTQGSEQDYTARGS